MRDEPGERKNSTKRKLKASRSLAAVGALVGVAVSLYSVPMLTIDYFREFFGNDEVTSKSEEPSPAEDSSSTEDVGRTTKNESPTEVDSGYTAEDDSAETQPPPLESISIEIDTRDNWRGERVGDNRYRLEEGELNITIAWVTLDQNGQEVHGETCDIEVRVENTDSSESQTPRNSSDCSGGFSPNYGGFPEAITDSGIWSITVTELESRVEISETIVVE